MAAEKPETVFDIEQLFAQLNSSFTTAALKLHEEFKDPKWAEMPFVYHMPKMHLSMRLVLSHSDGKVKGFFSKESSEKAQELTSTVEIDVVAVPRFAKPPTETP